MQKHTTTTIPKPLFVVIFYEKPASWYKLL
jgi:hypothetical protein